jgi:hypothetical protein
MRSVKSRVTLTKPDQPVIFILDGGEHDIRPEARPAFARAPCLSFKAAGFDGRLQFHLRLLRETIFGTEENREVFTEDFSGRVALETFRTLVPAGNPAVGTQGVNGVIFDSFQKQPKPIFRQQKLARLETRFHCGWLSTLRR